MAGKKYKVGNDVLDESQIQKSADANKMSVSDFISEAGAVEYTEPSQSKTYKVGNDVLTQEQVEKSAAASNMPVDDFLIEVGVKKKESSRPSTSGGGELGSKQSAVSQSTGTGNSLIDTFVPEKYRTPEVIAKAKNILKTLTGISALDKMTELKNSVDGIVPKKELKQILSDESLMDTNPQLDFNTQVNNAYAKIKESNSGGKLTKEQEDVFLKKAYDEVLQSEASQRMQLINQSYKSVGDDVQNNIDKFAELIDKSALPKNVSDWIVSQMSNVKNFILDSKTNPKVLEQYSRLKLQDVETRKQNELNKFKEDNPDNYTGVDQNGEVVVDQQEQKRRIEAENEIQKKYDKEFSDFQESFKPFAKVKAVGWVLSEALANDKIPDIGKIGAMTLTALNDPTHVKAEKMRTEEGISLTPTQKYQQDKVGLDAIKDAVVLYKPMADKGDEVAKNFIKLSNNILSDKNLIANRNIDFYKEQWAKRISNHLAQNPDKYLSSALSVYNNGGFKKALGLYDVDENMIKKIGEDVGAPANIISMITDDDIKTANIFGAAGAGLLGDVLSDASWGVEYIKNKNSGYSTQASAELASRWRDKESFFKKLYQVPEADELFNPSSVLSTDKSSPSYMEDVQNPNAGKLNINAYNFMNNAVYGFAQMLGLGKGGQATGKLLQKAGLISTEGKLLGKAADAEKAILNANTTSERIAASNKAIALTEKAANVQSLSDNVGMFTYGYVTGFSRNYQAGLQQYEGQENQEEKALLYGGVYSMIENAAEQMGFNEAKALRNLQNPSVKAMSDLVAKISEKGVKALEKNEVKDVVVDLLKSMGRMGKNTSEEISEELITNIGGKLTEMITGANKTDASFADEQVQTIVQTGIQMVLTVGLGEMRGKSPVRESLISQIANNPTYSIQAVNELHANGDISVGEKNKRIAIVNTLSKLNSQVPKVDPISGGRLNESEKVKYLNESYKEALAQKGIDETQNQTQIDRLEQVKKEAQKAQVEILDGVKLREESVVAPAPAPTPAPATAPVVTPAAPVAETKKPKPAPEKQPVGDDAKATAKVFDDIETNASDIWSEFENSELIQSVVSEDFTNEDIADAYHKAKKFNTNPTLVAAVENVIAKADAKKKEASLNLTDEEKALAAEMGVGAAPAVAPVAPAVESKPTLVVEGKKEEAPVVAEPISKKSGEVVTVNIGGKAITGTVEVDEGGRVTVSSGNTVVEVGKDQQYVDYASPVRLADNEDAIEVDGEVYPEVRFEEYDDNGVKKERAILIKSDGSVTVNKNPSIVEELKYQSALKAMNDLSEKEAEQIATNYDSERKTEKTSEGGVDKTNAATPAKSEQEVRLQEAVDEIDLIESMALEQLDDVEKKAKLVQHENGKTYLVEKKGDGDYAVTLNGRKVKDGKFKDGLAVQYEAQTKKESDELIPKLQEQVNELKKEVESKLFGESKKEESKKEEPLKQATVLKKKKSGVSNKDDVKESSTTDTPAAKTEPKVQRIPSEGDTVQVKSNHLADKVFTYVYRQGKWQFMNSLGQYENESNSRQEKLTAAWNEGGDSVKEIKPTVRAQGAIEINADNIEDVENVDPISIKGKMISDAKKVISALRSLAPDLKVVIFETDAEMKRAVGQSARGGFDRNTNTVYVNIEAITRNMANSPSKAKSNTVLHEGVHPILNAMAEADPELVDRLNAEIEGLIGLVDGVEAVVDFGNSYISTQGVSTAKMETIVEFISQVANGDIDVSKIKSPSVLSKIGKIVKGFIDFISGKDTKQEVRSAENIIKLAKQISEAFHSDKKVEVAQMIVTGSEKPVASLKLQAQLDILERTPNYKKVKQRPLSDFKGDMLTITKGDRLATGNLKLANGDVFNLKGGWAYTSETGGVWAAAGKAAANALANRLNESFEKYGASRLGVRVGGEETLLGNFSSFSVLLSHIKSALESKDISKGELFDKIKKAYGVRELKGKVSNVTKRTKINEIVNELMYEFNTAHATFEQRKAFAKSILGIRSKSGLPSYVELIDSLTDPSVKGVDVDALVAIVEVNSMVKVRETSAGEGGDFYHEAYPFVIEAEKTPKVFLLDGWYDIRDAVPEYEKEEGVTVKASDYAGNTSNQYTSGYGSAISGGSAMVSRNVKMNRAAKPAGEMQLQKDVTEGGISKKDEKFLTKGNNNDFLFFHYGNIKGGVIDSRKGVRQAYTRDRRRNSTNYYYTDLRSRENVVGGDVYVVSISRDKVYNFNKDPLNLYDKAEAKFKKEFPKFAFGAPQQMDYMLPLVRQAGFQMVIAKHDDMHFRAETMSPLPFDKKLTTQLREFGSFEGSAKTEKRDMAIVNKISEIASSSRGIKSGLTEKFYSKDWNASQIMSDEFMSRFIPQKMKESFDVQFQGDVVGIPSGNKLFNAPLEDAKIIADRYAEKNGFKRPAFEKITKGNFDKERAVRIAAAYDSMENNPKDPEVAAAYEAMVKETVAQYEEIIADGYQIEVNNKEPYENSGDMIQDLRDNKNMRIFSTESGFGSTPITDEQRTENPLLRDTGYKDKNGVPLLANDLFRFVHDFFGHAELGNSFGEIGEENAWNVHVRMFTPLARRAMTTETRGQNSWVNSSGVNDIAFELRDQAREFRKEGKIEEANKLTQQVYDMMKFADQKIGLLPEEFSKLDQQSGTLADLRGEVGNITYPDVLFAGTQTEESADIAVGFYESIVDKFNKLFGRDLKLDIKRFGNGQFEITVEYESGLKPKYFAYPTAKMGEHQVVPSINNNVPMTSLRHELIHEMLVKGIVDKFERINEMDNSAEAATIEDVQRGRAYTYSLEDVFYERVVEAIERAPDNVDTFDIATYGTDVTNRLSEEIKGAPTKANVKSSLSELLDGSNRWLKSNLIDIFNGIDYSNIENIKDVAGLVGQKIKQRFDNSKTVLPAELYENIKEFTAHFNNSYVGMLKENPAIQFQMPIDFSENKNNENETTKKGSENATEKQNVSSPTGSRNRTGSKKITGKSDGRGRTPKSRRKIKNPDYLRALSVESVGNPYTFALQWFIGGGGYSANLIRQLYGGVKRGGNDMSGEKVRMPKKEMDARISFLSKNGAEKIDVLGEFLSESYTDMFGMEVNDTNDSIIFRNIAEDIIGSFKSRRDMVDYINDKTDAQSEEAYEDAYGGIAEKYGDFADEAIDYLSEISDREINKLLSDQESFFNSDEFKDYIQFHNEIGSVGVGGDVKYEEREIPIDKIQNVNKDGQSLEDAKINVADKLGSRTKGKILVTENADGTYEVGDGFHRIAEAIKRGDKTIKADVRLQSLKETAKAGSVQFQNEINASGKDMSYEDKSFGDLTDGDLFKIALSGLKGEFAFSGVWDVVDIKGDSPTESEYKEAADVIVDDFKKQLNTAYPYGFKNFPPEPIVHRFIYAKSEGDINKNNLGESYFSDLDFVTGVKGSSDFFEQLEHLGKGLPDGNNLYLVSTRVPEYRINKGRTLWKRDANFNENEIVVSGTLSSDELVVTKFSEDKRESTDRHRKSIESALATNTVDKGEGQTLEIEARKYDNVDDFIKAQTLVYHGSQAPLKKFNNKQGTFFTDDMMMADGYAGGENVYEGYLNLKNPLVIDAEGRKWDDLKTPYGKTTQDVAGNLDTKKYDGIIFENIKDSWVDDVDYQDPSTIYYAAKTGDSFLNESQLVDLWNRANGGIQFQINAQESKVDDALNLMGRDGASFDPILNSNHLAELIKEIVSYVRKYPNELGKITSDVKTFVAKKLGLKGSSELAKDLSEALKDYTKHLVDSYGKISPEQIAAIENYIESGRDKSTVFSLLDKLAGVGQIDATQAAQMKDLYNKIEQVEKEAATFLPPEPVNVMTEPPSSNGEFYSAYRMTSSAEDVSNESLTGSKEYLYTVEGLDDSVETMKLELAFQDMDNIIERAKQAFGNSIFDWVNGLTRLAINSTKQGAMSDESALTNDGFESDIMQRNAILEKQVATLVGIESYLNKVYAAHRDGNTSELSDEDRNLSDAQLEKVKDLLVQTMRYTELMGNSASRQLNLFRLSGTTSLEGLRKRLEEIIISRKASKQKDDFEMGNKKPMSGTSSQTVSSEEAITDGDVDSKKGKKSVSNKSRDQIKKQSTFDPKNKTTKSVIESMKDKIQRAKDLINKIKCP